MTQNILMVFIKTLPKLVNAPDDKISKTAKSCDQSCEQDVIKNQDISLKYFNFRYIIKVFQFFFSRVDLIKGF